MISELIFNSDVFSGQILYIDNVKTTGAKTVFAPPISQFGTGSGSNIISLRSGQLGIGIIDPSFPLHVNGDGQLGGNFTVSGSFVIEGDNYTVGDSYVGGDFSVTGSSLTKGSSIIEGSSVIEGDNYTVGDSYVGGDFSVTGSSLTKGSSIIEGASVIEGDNYTVGDSYVGGDFSVTGSSLTKGSSIIEGASVIEGSNYTVTNSYVGGNFYVTGNSVVNGDLTVNGESFVVEATTVKIEDKNLEIGISSTGVETDTTANGGGITLHGDTSKTILWSNATDSWDLSENVGVADGKYIFTDKVRARDGAGLSIEDDGGNGIFIEDGGDVGIGTTSPSVGLEINHTDAVKIPKGTTSQRPTANAAAHKGYIRYNTTTNQFEGFGAGNSWGSLGGVIDVDQDTYVSAETSANTDNDELKFFTAGQERAIIKSDGKMGIGTTTPNEKLDVNGALYLRNVSALTTTSNRLYSVGGILYWDGENVLHARDTIGEMEDTSIGTKSNGQVLIWNATSSKWVNNALTGGNGIDVTNAAGGITISHSDTSSQATSNNSGRTYIQDIGLDTYGHVTSLATRTHSNAAITLTAGSGMSGGGSFDLDQSSAETITISHADTSSTASSNNSGRTYIQDIGIDTYGHVTSLSTATETVVNTNTTYSAGTGLTLSGTSFSVNSSQKGVISSIGRDANDCISIEAATIDFKLDGALDMQLKNTGDLHVDGKVVSFSNSTASDKKLKSNINTLCSSLDKVKNMRGVSFEWNAGNKKGQRDIGVIAQEMEGVLPEVVQDTILSVGEFKDNTEKYKTVDYEKIVPVLIEAIKELSDKLDQKTCCCCKANHNPKN